MAELPSQFTLNTNNPRAARGAPSYRGSPIGEAVQGFGRSLQELGLNQIEIEKQQRAKNLQTQDFGVKTRLVQFETNWNNALDTRFREAPPGAAGLTEQVVKDYVPSADEFAASIPAALRPAYMPQLARIEQQLTGASQDYEHKEGFRYGQQQTNDGLNTFLTDLTAHPERWPEYQTKGEELIRANPYYSESQRDVAVHDWTEKRRIATFDTNIKLNGVSEAYKLGVTPGGGQRISQQSGAALRSVLTPDKAPDHVDNLNGAFADRLVTLFQNAPPEMKGRLGITSGFRTVARQKELFDAEVEKTGSIETARKTVAPPGHSQHNYGNAVDLSWDGHLMRADNTPPEVLKWVKENIGGLQLDDPVAGEPWHLEPVEARRGQKTAADADPATGTGLLAAMEHVESGGNPNAVSRKGAIGLMQIMPGTAKEIARDLGDVNFPATTGDSDIYKYLSDPGVSRRYGAAYMNKMLAKYGGDTEAALVAYNGGPGRADAWLSAGRDYSVLPQETAEYVQKVKAALGGGGPGVMGVNPDYAGIPYDKRVAMYDQAIAVDRAQFAKEVDDMSAYLRSGVGAGSDIVGAPGANQVPGSGAYPGGGGAPGNAIDAMTTGSTAGAPVGNPYSLNELMTRLGPDAGVKAYDKLNADAAYGYDVAATKFASPAEQEALVAQREALLASPTGFQQHLQDVTELKSVIKEQNAALAADPAKYAMEHPTVVAARADFAATDPNDTAALQQASQRYAQAQMSVQTVLGVAPEKQSILAKPDIAEIARKFSLSEEGRAQSVADQMGELQRQWGDAFPKVFEQLARDNALPGVALVIGSMMGNGYIDQRLPAERLARVAQLGAKKIADILPDEDVKSLKSQINTDMGQFLETMQNQPGGIRTYTTFNEAAYLLGLSYMAAGEDYKGASEHAYNDIIGMRYEMQGSYRVPKEWNVNNVRSGAAAAREAIYNNTGPESLTGPLMVDSIWMRQGVLTPQEAEDEYRKSIAVYGTWITSADEKGLVLFDGDMRLVRRPDGTPVGADFETLQKMGIKRGGAGWPLARPPMGPIGPFGPTPFNPASRPTP